MPTVFRYDTVGEWLQVAKDANFSSYAIAKVYGGDTSIVPAASRALDRVRDQLVSREPNQWTPAVAGQRISVPDYLAGSPMAMRRKTRREGHVRHVTIYVEGCVVDDVGPREVAARNTAIVGLVEALKVMRIGVDLYVTWDTDDNGKDDGDCWQVIRIDSNPIDVSRVASVLSYEAMCKIAFPIKEKLLDDGCGVSPSASYMKVIRAYRVFGMAARVAAMAVFESTYRRAMGMAPTDIYVPEIRPEDYVVRNPAKWIETMISQVTQ